MPAIDPSHPTLSRRGFLRTSLRTGLLATGCCLGGFKPKTDELGVYITLQDDPDRTLAKVRQMGFSLAEVYCNRTDDALATGLKAAMAQHGVHISAFFALGPGPTVWDFYQGPQTIGLVPRKTRRQRVDALKRASDIARLCGIPALETHCGFIPENPGNPLYGETVAALRELVSHCRGNGQTFLYHAGQETPTALLRTIEDVDLDNQGVGLDTANPIMYDKGHPIYALDVYGKWLKAVNIKDGRYPTDPRNLGKEVRVGQGAVDFPRFLRKLKAMDYRGPIIIERETSGPQQIADIAASKVYLENILKTL
jgi:sugar phosphate isomerase/epimerase